MGHKENSEFKKTIRLENILKERQLKIGIKKTYKTFADSALKFKEKGLKIY